MERESLMSEEVDRVMALSDLIIARDDRITDLQVRLAEAQTRQVQLAGALEKQRLRGNLYKTAMEAQHVRIRNLIAVLGTVGDFKGDRRGDLLTALGKALDILGPTTVL